MKQSKINHISLKTPTRGYIQSTVYASNEAIRNLHHNELTATKNTLVLV